MRIDLHCHTRYSNDNFLEPETVIHQAIDRGLEGVCFTEHHSYEASRTVEDLVAPDGFVVLRGMEVTTNSGHLLVYGVRDDSWNVWSRNNYLDLEEVIKRVHDLGGICVPAHPYRGWDSIGSLIYVVGGLDAVETHNGINTPEANSRAAEAALYHGLPSIGGSDCHKSEQVGRAYTVFDKPVWCMEELIREIRLGNCRGEVK
jgi:predicted metal-dependent phosphoesterase TrpH